MIAGEIYVLKSSAYHDYFWKDHTNWEYQENAKSTIRELYALLKRTRYTFVFFDKKVKFYGWNVLTYNVPQKCKDIRSLANWLKEIVQKEEIKMRNRFINQVNN